ncbi:hypothetical protein BsWGS_28415 [Bradybaena similaris]
MTAKMASACLPLILLIFCVIFVHVESQNCQEGWHFFNGSCYSFSGLQVMWAEALAICKAFNAKLAEIETSEENEFLKNLAREKSADSTFLGGTDIFEDGFWVWTSSGKHIYPFVDWAPNEPSNVGKNYFKLQT